ncbi:MAG: hypothetical protein AAGB32_04285 [Pseudomonadota bacterium]
MALTEGQKRRSFQTAREEGIAKETFVNGLCGGDFFGGGVYCPDETERDQGPKKKPSRSTFGDMVP